MSATELPQPAGPRSETRVAPPAGRQIRVQTQFSPGFGDWLIRHRVGLVASTYQTGHLLFIGVREDGLPVPSAMGFSRAMGLYASPQRLYVGAAREIWRLENALEPNELDNGLFDRLYVPRNCQVTGDVNIHELAVESDGRIVFCNTLYSCLATLDMTKAFKPIWRPRFISKLAPEDRCHLNGLALEDGQARYVTCCSTGDALESWRGGRRDAGVLIDVTTDEIVADGLSMPHSPRVCGDAIYLVESGRGVLVRLDQATGRRADVTFLPGFARGLAIEGDYAVITVSLPRSAALAGLPLSAALDQKQAAPSRGLMIVNLRNGDIEEWLRIEGDIVEMFDVACISGVRSPRGARQAL